MQADQQRAAERKRKKTDRAAGLKGFTLNHVQVGNLRAIPTASQDVGGACWIG